MSTFRKVASFLRWRLVPVRYVTMLLDLDWRKVGKNPPPRLAVNNKIVDSGFQEAAPIPEATTQAILAIYGPRTSSVVPKKTGHPFVNLFSEEDISEKNPVLRLAFSAEILDVATDYFGGRLILDSVQVLFSYSTGGEIRESQYWHLDYGDRKSFHAVAYLNDVMADDDGPFVFADKATSRKVGRSLTVRRIPDAQFIKESGGQGIQRFLGKAGSMIYVDPSACYHFGSRCTGSRLAIFVTFSSWFPFANPANLISNNRSRLLEAARIVRPDLGVDFLKSILRL